jgi:glycosyltransferase involved in cell wall biosynthesis
MRDFVQAGAQRYQYEIIKALDKDKYEIDILALKPLNSALESGFLNEYYLPLLKELVHDIIFLSEVQKFENKALRWTNNRFINPFKKVNAIEKIVSIAENPLKNRALSKLNTIAQNYDYINCTDYDYVYLKDLDIDLKKLLILVVTTKMQTFPHCQFKDFDYNKRYNFVAVWEPATDAIEFSNFKNGYNIVRFSLIIDTSIFKLVPYPKPSNTFKIGIFTRIDYRLKPLEPFFYALHILKSRGINVQLHLYGAGDPSGFKRTINTLSLQDAVIFEGHQEDLGAYLNSAELNMAWFQANNYEPAGYAAFEVMGRGVPNLFWDFQPLSKHKPQGAAPYPMFWDVEKMANYTQHLLYNPDEAENLGITQRDCLIETQHAANMIGVLENHYDTHAVDYQFLM